MAKRLEYSLIALMAALGLYLYWIAATLGLDMYDTYEIFLNSRLISGDPAGWYFPARAYIFPLILSPGFFLTRHLSSDPAGAGLVISHLTSMTLVCLLVWMTYRLFRLHLTRLQSLCGAALFFFNRLVVHMAPISKEDLPGTLFTVTLMYFYLRHWETGKRRDLWLTAFFMFLVMGTRYNVIPLIPIVLAAYEIIGRRPRLRLGALTKKGIVLVALPVLVWLAVPTLIYVHIGRASLFDATGKYLTELYHASVGAVGSEMAYPEYPWENLGFLIRSYTPPIFLAALWGMVVAWRRRTKGSLLHALWLGVFLAFHSFVLGHKEARYLFTMFTPVYFFAILGLSDVLARIRHGTAKTAVAAALAIWPLALGVAECVRFQAGFYQENFVRRIAEKAASFSKEGPITWLGPFYAIHPQDYVFDLEDEVTYLYHVFIHSVRYYTGRPMLTTPRAFRPYVPEGLAKNGVFPPPALTYKLTEGEGVILNLEPSPYVTKDVPERLKPLIVERAHVVDFSKATPGRGGTLVLESPKLAGAKLTIAQNDKVFTFTQKGLGDKTWVVYVRFNIEGQLGCPGLIDQTRPDAALTLDRSKLPAGARPVSAYLLGFDSTSTYVPAGM